MLVTQRRRRNERGTAINLIMIVVENES